MSTTPAGIAPEGTETAAERIQLRDLTEYQKIVYKEAIRVAKQQGWCDDGLDTTLRNLGLPGKVIQRIPMTITAEQVVWVDVPGAVSVEEAQQIASEYPELLDVGNGNTRRWKPVGATPVPDLFTPFAELTEPTVGMEYPFLGHGGATCESYQGGYYCQLPKGTHDDESIPVVFRNFHMYNDVDKVHRFDAVRRNDDGTAIKISY